MEGCWSSSPNVERFPDAIDLLNGLILGFTRRMADLSRGDSDYDREVRDVTSHDRTRANDGALPHSNTWQKCGIAANACEVFNPHRSCQSRRRHHMNTVSNMAIMFDDGTRVENGEFSDLGKGVNDCHRHELISRSHFRRIVYKSGPMSQAQSCKTTLPKETRNRESFEATGAAYACEKVRYVWDAIG